MGACAMGHTRLGGLPRTRAWGEVVGLIAGGAGVAQVANATMNAAERGLNLAANDKALTETVWLLTQLPIAARSPNFVESLRDAGLSLPDAPGLMDVVAAVSDAIDAKLVNGSRTDLGEMAQLAAAETITQFVSERKQSMFGVNAADVKDALSSLGKNAEFSKFARDFFGKLTNRCLDYFLSRALSHHVGEDRRFTTLAEQARFTDALRLHCKEASKIVEDFSGGWFSKTNWEQGGITKQAATGFTHIAMRKLASELKAGTKS